MGRPLNEDEIEKIVRKVIQDELNKLVKNLKGQLSAIQTAIEWHADACDNYHDK